MKEIDVTLAYTYTCQKCFRDFISPAELDVIIPNKFPLCPRCNNKSGWLR